MDKRIDVLATAMYAGITALQLKELDLSYAPPYSSAKDPVNMAGFMIENIAEGRLKQFFTEDVENLPRDGSVILLDARTPGEYARGHIEGFINIPVDELRDRISELDKKKKVYIICQSGLRSYIAYRILAQEALTAGIFPAGSGCMRQLQETAWQLGRRCLWDGNKQIGGPNGRFFRDDNTGRNFKIWNDISRGVSGYAVS